jgi:L-lysine 6-transaminase
MTPTATGTSVHVTPDQVHATLAKHMLADGFDFVLDLDKSQGVWLHDSRGNKTLMDFFSFFASNPVGFESRSAR